MRPDEDQVALAGRVVARLADLGLTLGTCESLTGGGVAAELTRVPGASRVFRGSLVTYASDLKVSLAGVDACWVAAHGVVNEHTARQMAMGARQSLQVDLAVACTGVAGPDPQDGEDVGTVWIAVAGPADDQVGSRRLQLQGARQAIRELTTAEIFAELLEWV